MMATTERTPYLTKEDKRDLSNVIELICEVIERHHMEMTIPTMATLDHAIHDVRTSEKRMAGGW